MIELLEQTEPGLTNGLMKANVYHGSGKYGLETKPIPRAAIGEACGSGAPDYNLWNRYPHCERRVPDRCGADHRARGRGKPSMNLARA